MTSPPLDATLNKYSLEYEYAELSAATGGFAATQALGSGSFGAVFRGVQRDGTDIAVKVLELPDSAGFNEEVRVLSKFRHPNLVTLMGFARHGSHRFLVYELLGGGDVHHRLRDCKIKGLPFSGSQRISVAFDAACGLSHLHNSTPKVFHRDIKSPNILLDRNGNAKMADFGLACLSNSSVHQVQETPGTIGYADPLYVKRGVITEASEVYSFGMVLLELVTGQAPAKVEKGRHGYTFLITTLRNSIAMAVAMADSNAQWPQHMLEAVADLGFRCAHDHEDCRPDFRALVHMLRTMRDAPDAVHAPSSRACTPTPRRVARTSTPGRSSPSAAESQNAEVARSSTPARSPSSEAGSAKAPAQPRWGAADIDFSKAGSFGLASAPRCQAYGMDRNSARAHTALRASGTPRLLPSASETPEVLPFTRYRTPVTGRDSARVPTPIRIRGAIAGSPDPSARPPLSRSVSQPVFSPPRRQTPDSARACTPMRPFEAMVHGAPAQMLPNVADCQKVWQPPSAQMREVDTNVAECQRVCMPPSVQTPEADTRRNSARASTPMRVFESTAQGTPALEAALRQISAPFSFQAQEIDTGRDSGRPSASMGIFEAASQGNPAQMSSGVQATTCKPKEVVDELAEGDFLWSLDCVAVDGSDLNCSKLSDCNIDFGSITHLHKHGQLAPLRVGRLMQPELFDNLVCSPSRMDAVSREHFHIWAEQQVSTAGSCPASGHPCIFYISNRSGNGTLVNGHRLRKLGDQMQIHSGDIIALPRTATTESGRAIMPFISFSFSLVGSALCDASPRPKVEALPESKDGLSASPCVPPACQTPSPPAAASPESPQGGAEADTPRAEDRDMSVFMLQVGGSGMREGTTQENAQIMHCIRPDSVDCPELVLGRSEQTKFWKDVLGQKAWESLSRKHLRFDAYRGQNSEGRWSVFVEILAEHREIYIYNSLKEMSLQEPVVLRTHERWLLSDGDRLILNTSQDCSMWLSFCASNGMKLMNECVRAGSGASQAAVAPALGGA